MNEKDKNFIEAIIFRKTSATKLSELSKLTGFDDSKLREILSEVTTDYSTRGVNLFLNDQECWFATNPNLVNKFSDSELSETGLGTAATETLAIILYRGPMNKREIDIIRGVNTQSILRTLLIRELIDRDLDGAEYRYRASHKLLTHLGIDSSTELPNHEDLNQKIADLEKSYAE